MNLDQVRIVRELVEEFAEKSGTDFDAAFKRVLGIARYHAIDVVPWGKTIAANASAKRGQPAAIEQNIPPQGTEK